MGCPPLVGFCSQFGNTYQEPICELSTDLFSLTQSLTPISKDTSGTRSNDMQYNYSVAILAQACMAARGGVA